jgi:hypothetical protein
MRVPAQFFAAAKSMSDDSSCGHLQTICGLINPVRAKRVDGGRAIRIAKAGPTDRCVHAFPIFERGFDRRLATAFFARTSVT